MRAKLEAWGEAEDSEEVIAALLREDFINETRYAGAYARDKFRFNSWGKRKIALHLIQKGISREDIDAGLGTINNDDYMDAALALMRQKLPKTKGDSNFERMQKCKNFALSRGFEPDLVDKCAKLLAQNKSKQ